MGKNRLLSVVHELQVRQVPQCSIAQIALTLRAAAAVCGAHVDRLGRCRLPFSQEPIDCAQLRIVRVGACMAFDTALHTLREECYRPASASVFATQLGKILDVTDVPRIICLDPLVALRRCRRGVYLAVDRTADGILISPLRESDCDLADPWMVRKGDCVLVQR